MVHYPRKGEEIQIWAFWLKLQSVECDETQRAYRFGGFAIAKATGFARGLALKYSLSGGYIFIFFANQNATHYSTPNDFLLTAIHT
jgi:hypothetical protein